MTVVSSRKSYESVAILELKGILVQLREQKKAVQEQIGQVEQFILDLVGGKESAHHQAALFLQNFTPAPAPIVNPPTFFLGNSGSSSPPLSGQGLVIEDYQQQEFHSSGEKPHEKLADGIERIFKNTLSFLDKDKDSKKEKEKEFRKARRSSLEISPRTKKSSDQSKPWRKTTLFTDSSPTGIGGGVKSLPSSQYANSNMPISTIRCH